MPDPTPDLGAETLAMLEAQVRSMGSAAKLRADETDETVLRLREQEARYAHAAQCVKLVAAINEGVVSITHNPTTLHYTEFGFGASLTTAVPVRRDVLGAFALATGGDDGK